jgi:hypothetical protein
MSVLILLPLDPTITVTVANPTDLFGMYILIIFTTYMPERADKVTRPFSLQSHLISALVFIDLLVVFLPSNCMCLSPPPIKPRRRSPAI